MTDKPKIPMPQKCAEPKSFPFQPPPKAPEYAEVKAAEPILMPELEFMSFTVDEINLKTDKELKEILSGEAHPDKCLSLPMQALINSEIRYRAIEKASKPKPLANAGSIAGIISVIITVISFLFWTNDRLSQSKTPDMPDRNTLTSQKSALPPAEIQRPPAPPQFSADSSPQPPSRDPADQKTSKPPEPQQQPKKHKLRTEKHP